MIKSKSKNLFWNNYQITFTNLWIFRKPLPYGSKIKHGTLTLARGIDTQELNSLFLCKAIESPSD